MYFVSTKYSFTFFYTHYSINIFTIDVKLYKFEKSKKISHLKYCGFEKKKKKKSKYEKVDMRK